MKIGPDLAQRTISALIMIPVVVGLTFYGGIPFILLWLVATAGVLHEWGHVARLRLALPFFLLGLAGTAVAAGAIHLQVGEYALPLILVVAFVGAVLTRNPALGAAGILAGALASLPIVALRGEDHIGLSAVLFIYAIVWGTDIGAYFVGRIVGGPKLWPRLSPSKTWAGATGGAVIGTLAGSALLLGMGLHVSPVLVLVSLILSVAVQFGDLAESAFKRTYGVKDAGSIIPGHGGLLDRLDGFMAAAVIALLLGVARDFQAPASGLLLW